MTPRTFPTVSLEPLTAADRETFITENQAAFNYGSLIEFGERNTIFEEDGQIISRATIEHSIDEGEAYRILHAGHPVGGLVVQVTGAHGSLDLLFISPAEHSRGLGQAAWAQVEARYPQVEVWETFTPYFETRNLHFYVNRLGFEILEFFNEDNPNPHEFEEGEDAAAPASPVDAGEVHEDFLFVKERVPGAWQRHLTEQNRLDARRPAPWALDPSGTEGKITVAYRDCESLHRFINERGFRGLAYEPAGAQGGWIHLHKPGAVSEGL